MHKSFLNRERVKMISIKKDHNLLLDEAGNLFVWGSNKNF